MKNKDTRSAAVDPMNILIVDDEPNIRKMLEMCLEAEGHTISQAASAKEALQLVDSQPIDMAFLDLRLGADSGMELLPELMNTSPSTRVVIITAYASVDTAVEAMKLGATDYVSKPFTPSQISVAVKKVAERQRLEQEVEDLQRKVSSAAPEVKFYSESPRMKQALSLAEQVAPSEAIVLLRGESGTGKTLMASQIHDWSPRKRKAFTVISCPSLSAELLESELFGHVRGAFTGAQRDNPGRIAISQGGTVFLDEIGDLPLSLQPKLLRFIQDREYERVGDTTTRRADVRIIAATNSDLEEAVKEGKFREDLYYRLNVIEIELAALRDRREDIIPLAEDLLQFFAAQYHRKVNGFTEKARRILMSYRWPGNIRELRNVIERAILLCQDKHITEEHLPLRVKQNEAEPVVGDLISLEKMEEIHIRHVLTQANSLEEAARILQIDPTTLWRRRKKYGI